MIDDKDIEWYFDNMKSKGIISKGWVYDGFRTVNNNFIIMFKHKSDSKKTVSFRKSSYTFPKEIVISELRELKLSKLFD